MDQSVHCWIPAYFEMPSLAGLAKVLNAIITNFPITKMLHPANVTKVHHQALNSIALMSNLFWMGAVVAASITLDLLARGERFRTIEGS